MPNEKLVSTLTDGALAVLAQAGVDPVSGLSGWTSAGIAGLVLSWLLLRHLPDKDKQLKDLLAEKDKQLESKDMTISALVKAKDEAINQAISAFRAEIKEQRIANEATTERICQVFRETCEAERSHYLTELERVARAIECYRGKP